jgi:hypothetical protein
MPIGFIPSNDNHVHASRELCPACEQWFAQQVAEACERNAALKDAYRAVLEEVRKYAAQLELFDGQPCSAEQEMAAVAIRLSYAETGQDCLDALIAEARRLKQVVAEAKRQGFAPAELPSISSRLAPMREGLLSALFLGVGIFMGVLMARGVL